MAAKGGSVGLADSYGPRVGSRGKKGEEMKALYFDGESLQYRTDYPMPKPAGGESLLRMEMAAICNTDKEIMHGFKKGFRGVLGHEFVAVVEESPEKSLIGRRVVGELNIGCGRCLYCRTNREEHCEDRLAPGISGNKDGCFAEYMAYATRLLHPVPEQLATEKAIYTEPLSAGIAVMQHVHIKPSEPVAVIGDGRLALMTAQAVAQNGTPVVVFGKHAGKLGLFSSFAQTSLEPSGTFETVLEISGSPSGFATAMKLVRSKGTIVLKSTYAGMNQADLTEVVVREITIVGSRNGNCYPAALNLLRRSGMVLPDITLYRLADYREAFASTAFKAGFDFRYGPK